MGWTRTRFRAKQEMGDQLTIHRLLTSCKNGVQERSDQIKTRRERRKKERARTREREGGGKGKGGQERGRNAGGREGREGREPIVYLLSPLASHCRRDAHPRKSHRCRRVRNQKQPRGRAARSARQSCRVPRALLFQSQDHRHCRRRGPQGQEPRWRQPRRSPNPSWRAMNTP